MAHGDVPPLLPLTHHTDSSMTVHRHGKRRNVSGKLGLPLFLFPVIFAITAAVLFSLLWMLRLAVQKDEGLAGVHLTVPHNWAALREDSAALRHVADRHQGLFLACLMVAYLFKQSFAVPGSVLLNAAAGATLGAWRGVPLVCLLSACGATGGYFLSYEFGGGLLVRLGLESRLAPMKASVEASKRDPLALTLMLISLRSFPASPHWAINALAPHAGVPLLPFVVSALVGMAPYNFLTVKGGELIATTEWADVLTPQRLAGLAAVAIAIFGLSQLVKRRRGAGGEAQAGEGGASDPSESPATPVTSSRSSAGGDGTPRSATRITMVMPGSSENDGGVELTDGPSGPGRPSGNLHARVGRAGHLQPGTPEI